MKDKPLTLHLLSLRRCPHEGLLVRLVHQHTEVVRLQDAPHDVFHMAYEGMRGRKERVGRFRGCLVAERLAAENGCGVFEFGVEERDEEAPSAGGWDGLEAIQLCSASFECECSADHSQHCREKPQWTRHDAQGNKGDEKVPSREPSPCRRWLRDLLSIEADIPRRACCMN
jgi:hypothetical protein